MPLRMSEIVPGVIRFATRYENWYLLEQGGRLTLLDTGLPGDWAGFVSALSRLGHTLADVEAVLISHHHPDHRGTAEQLRGHGARVLAHPADAPYIQAEKRINPLSTVPYLRHRWYAAYVLHLLRKGVLSAGAVGALHKMADGEVLDVPGGPRVIHVPGHTAGSCGLWLKERSILFSGDALVTLDMTRGRTGPQIIRGPVTEDAATALESLDMLAATKAGTVLPGHGEPWYNGIEGAVELARRTASN